MLLTFDKPENVNLSTDLIKDPDKSNDLDSFEYLSCWNKIFWFKSICGCDESIKINKMNIILKHILIYLKMK